MVDNPVLLVDQVSSTYTDTTDNCCTFLDAIFVPFKSRSSYIQELLVELVWFEGPVYLMPSDKTDMASLCVADINVHTTTLMVDDAEFKRFHNNLLTSQHRLTSAYIDLWDLPLKRNYALFLSRQKGYKAVLIIDDDIRNVDHSCTRMGTNLLNSYKVSGCLVTDFPDTSVLGHLERVAGQEVFPFLSGSFLFINPMHVRSFFPCIYNEDWLFMLPYIHERSICSFGTIKQVPYDPFTDFDRAKFQEFGEVIVDGLYDLLEKDKYDRRHILSIWKNIIAQRCEKLRKLLLVLDGQKYGNTIETMLNVNRGITPVDCVNFVNAWEKDTRLWNKFLEEKTK